MSPKGFPQIQERRRFLHFPNLWLFLNLWEY